MKLKKQLQSRLLKTQTFKGLVDDFTKDNNLKIVTPKQLEVAEKKAKTKAVKKEVSKIVKAASEDARKDERALILKNELPSIVQGEIEKSEIMKKNEAMRYSNPGRVNSQQNPDRKPGADVPFSVLRRMATLYPIARACINRRIRQITQLEWDITTIDEIENEKGYETQIELVKEFFKHPMGHKTRMRELLTLMIDDVMTLDATTFEIQRTRGKDFMYLIPVDPATIALRVTETGATPEPPEPAYRQIIAGQKIAEFTTDEMIYESIGNRSYNPYGQAPLESLILQAESAIQGALYNLSYFKESNVPAGFLTLADGQVTTKSQVEEFQMWFDAIMSGDLGMMHKLKILPGGSVYTPSQKVEDMAFERFELWLLQQTCAVFDVQPQDIGITLHVNKSTAESQSEIGISRGLIPLSNFVKEIFDDLIQNDLGFTELQFSWNGLNPVDRKEEAEIAQIEIDMGAKSVDEYRTEQGLEPVGLKHYIKNGNGIILVDDIVSGKYSATQDAMLENKNKNNFNNDDEENDSTAKMELEDLKRWRKVLYANLKDGKPLRKNFNSEYINPETHKQIEEGLEGVSNRLQVKLLFDQFLDPEIKASMKMLALASEMRKVENVVPA